MTQRKLLWITVLISLLLTACAIPVVTPVQTAVVTVSNATTGGAPGFVTVTLQPTLAPAPTLAPTTDPITEIIFTGSIVLGRCVQAAIDEHGQADFLYDDVREMLSEADLAVGTLNAALSDYPPHTGCVQTFVLVGSANNADAMANAGFDVMSVATNHIKNCGLPDCGDRAFLDTLANLHRVYIDTIGAGESLSAALAPVVVRLHGTRFGFISLGELEPSAFARTYTPGIAALTEGNLIASIAAARAVSDVVIVMPHWGPEYSAMPNYAQLNFAQVAVEAGADLVIGNHTHVIQGYQEIQGVPVFYGLGSFVFDQSWSEETQQGLVLRVRFDGSRLLDYELIPVHIDANGHVQRAHPLESDSIIQRIESINERIPNVSGE